MLPVLPPQLRAFLERLCQSPPAPCAPVAVAAALVFVLPGMARAQADQAPEAQKEAVPQPKVAFEADQVDFDSNADTVTVSGEVILRRDGQEVRADHVIWNRQSGEIVATGNIRFTDPDGNMLYTPRMVLTDELRAGAMENLLMAFAEGGRMAANKAVRSDDGKVLMTDAAYSGCAVVDPDGCDKKPSWRITSDRVVYDPERQHIRFLGARLEMFGMRLIPLPGLGINTRGRANTGLLIPNFGFSRSNGVEASGTYYGRLGDNRDIALTAFAYSDSAPMLRARYRALTESGAYQVTGYVTHSARIPIGTGSLTRRKDLRGYFAANGRFQLSPLWSVTASARIASDRTFLRRYDITRDDRLRSTIDIERIDANSYLSIAGWATQTLRFGDAQGQVPIALPVIDYRRRLGSSVLGGRAEFQANSLAITRTDGQDSQRAFAQARWDMRRITGMGQEVTLTGLVRGDVYHSSENGFTQTAIYRGQPGWKTRGVALGAIDVKWPLIGKAFGGTQVLTPHVQLVATPRIRNLAVPNEDARAIDLEDSNLFALNRFPGYDRIEDGVRFTYGFDWQLDRPGWQIKTTIGQSYRLSNKPALLPDGTGLDSRFSDYVGRTEIRFRDFLKLTHRFRLDKDSLAFRRNEFDAAVGSKKTYVEVAYLRLDRNIAAGIEDLRDREEVRLSTRVAFAKYWSLFGSGVFNLTDRKEDPSLTSDGFDPLRTRLGIAYQDDCLEVGLTWRRDYADSGDAKRGNSFQVYFALRNLGLP